MTQNGMRSVLERHPVIPVVTFHEEREVNATVEKLLAQNINCIEITLRTDFALNAIQLVKERFAGKMEVGVGTVINETQVNAVKALEVDFIVSPAFYPELIHLLRATGIPFIPGAVTPGELVTGMHLGCDTFKFFPAALYGGVNALKTFGDVFPSLKFCPTGGIKEETHRDYLALPNVVSVGGSWMLK